MKKKFKVLNLDCPNCAAKFENAIKAIEGVKKAQVNFLAQKLVIEAEDVDLVMPQVKEELLKIAKDGEII